METKSPRRNVVTVRINEQEREFLERVAQEDGRDVSNVLRLALKEFYDRRIAQEAFGLPR